MFNKDNSRGGFAPRQMVQGNWSCGQDDQDNKGCGKAITELPFEPSSGRPIYCRDCWAKNRPPKRY